MAKDEGPVSSASSVPPHARRDASKGGCYTPEHVRDMQMQPPSCIDMFQQQYQQLRGGQTARVSGGK